MNSRYVAVLCLGVVTCCFFSAMGTKARAERDRYATYRAMLAEIGAAEKISDRGDVSPQGADFRGISLNRAVNVLYDVSGEGRDIVISRSKTVSGCVDVTVGPKKK